jgi:hypothetical protein
MGSWRYCNKCGMGQSRITFEEVETAYICEQKVPCQHCEEPREDDHLNERLSIVIEVVKELKEAVEEMKNAKG